MAIFIPGMPCSICKLPMRTDDGLIGFQHFVSNRADPLFFFTDATFHAACFHQHPLAAQAQARYDKVKSGSGRGNRGCFVCRQQVADPDEHLYLGYLADDPNSPLYPFNYLQFHRACLAGWDKHAELLVAIENLKGSPEYADEWVDAVVEEIKDPVGIILRRREILKRQLTRRG